MPVLVDVCKNSHPNQIGTVIRAATNLDGLLYGFTSAFSLLTKSLASRAFFNQIEEEVLHPIDITSSSKASELLRVSHHLLEI